MNIELPEALQLKLEEHALSDYPNECCGFLFGSDKGAQRNVTEVLAVTNAKTGDQRRRFEIDPMDYLKSERYALENNLSLLGIYHSHPNHPAKPSKHDLAQAVSFFSYVIISLDQQGIQDITSWQLQNQRFLEEQIILNKKIKFLN